MTNFESLYHAYFNDVYRYILRLSGNMHIAEEITSETFFKALKSIDHFRGDCEARVWLCQIAKNCYYSYIKKNEKTISSQDEELLEHADPSEDVDEKCAEHDMLERIQKILHNINEPYKEVFMWRIYAQLSFSQIGKMFGKSENWACVTYHRARKMIKERLEEPK